MIRSIIQQNNSLVNVSDFITIKTETPINPQYLKIIGFYLSTNDIIDNQNTVGVFYYIVPESQLTEISESDISSNWIQVDKSSTASLNNFLDSCNTQVEPYYIWFKFEKLSGTEILTINKFNLQFENLTEVGNYPNYLKSIFKDKLMYDEETMKWTYNVYDKIADLKGGILPTFIKRDKDFSLIWTWIIHSFAIIVTYARQFLDIFKDSALFDEFLRQKDYYRDLRGDINTDIVATTTGELGYHLRPNIRIAQAGYPTEVEGFACSNLIGLKENNYVKVELTNIGNLGNFKYKTLSESGSLIVGDSYRFISSVIGPIPTTYYYRIYVSGPCNFSYYSGRPGSGGWSTIQSFTAAGYYNVSYTTLITPGVYFSLGLVNNTAGSLLYGYVQLTKEEYNEAVAYDIELNNLFGNKFIEVDVAFYDNKKNFVVQYTVDIDKEHLETLLYVEKQFNIYYVAFSYKMGDVGQAMIKLSCLGEGNFTSKTLTKTKLLNVYPTFKNRGTLHSADAIKKICQIELSDTFFSGYMNQDNSPFILDKGSGFTNTLRNHIILKEFIPEKFTPVDNGEFVEFLNYFVKYSDNNSICLKWDYSVLALDENAIIHRTGNGDFNNDYNEDYLSASYTYEGVIFFKKIIVFISVYDENYIKRAGGILGNAGASKIAIEITNLPANIKEIEIPITCIENAQCNNVRQNLIKLDYFDDIYLFTKKVKIGNTNYNLKYIQLDAIHFVKDNTNYDNFNYVIGAYIDQKASLSSIKLTRITATYVTIQYTYSSSGTTATVNYPLSTKQSDTEKGYIKLVINDSNILGVILLKNIIANSLNVEIPISDTQNKIFTLDISGVNSFERAYNFIAENAAADWGNAFSYYYRPYVEFGNANPQNYDEFVTIIDGIKDSTGDYWNTILDVRFVLRKLPYNFNFLDIKDYYLTYYGNNGKFSDKELEEIISQKFVPYRGFRLFQNIEKNNVLVANPLKITILEVSNGYNWTATSGDIHVTWSGGYPPYSVKLTDENGSEQTVTTQNKHYSFEDLNFGKYNLEIIDNTGKVLKRPNISLVKTEELNLDFKLNIYPGSETQVNADHYDRGEYDDIKIMPKGGTPSYEIIYTDKNGVEKHLYTLSGRFIQLKDYPFKRGLISDVTINSWNLGTGSKGSGTYAAYVFNKAMTRGDILYICAKVTFPNDVNLETNIPLMVSSNGGTGYGTINTILSGNNKQRYLKYTANETKTYLFYLGTYSAITWSFAEITQVQYESVGNGISNPFRIKDSKGFYKDFNLMYTDFYEIFDNGEGSCILTDGTIEDQEDRTVEEENSGNSGSGGYGQAIEEV